MFFNSKFTSHCGRKSNCIFELILCYGAVLVVEVGTERPGCENLLNRLLSSRPQNKQLIKEALEYTDRFLLTTLSLPLDSHIVVAQ